MTLRRLAADYRRATGQMEARRAALYAAIREAHASGRTYRAIAEETGLSFPRIQQIVKEHQP